ncbi:serine/threonine-protein kinase [Acetobacter okinawensis]|uniref:serine/threonine-protein kinase n=1 Tax=Acetobacter okinawensis TaxID=1076594 RepID=UPI00046F731A|nr:serine/threonine-protein kinase [Acetobacter okinawensis]
MSDRLGKYELRRILGKGAMGTVYEGYDPVIDRTVAIKTVRLVDADSEDAQAIEELERFRREAKAAGRLQHPNIVGVFDYGETDDIAYIVMEYVDGTTLKQVLDSGERYGVDEVVRLMDALLSGLQFSTTGAWCTAISSPPTSC